MRGNAHVRFGGRAEETGWEQSRYRASARPYCGERFLGQQQCPQRRRFCRTAGLGGLCPGCDEPVLVTELLGELPEARP